MKRLLPFILLTGLTMGVTSCKEKKAPEQNIIVKKPEVKTQPAKTIKMESITLEPKQVEWITGTYTIEVSRYADESLPLATDESGQQYYDNKISLKVRRADGSLFIDRTFSKSDFNAFLDNHTKETGALLGLPFVEVDGNSLVFAASVGSPDDMSDNFVPMLLKISRMGDINIQLDAKRDIGSDNPDMAPVVQSEEGV